MHSASSDCWRARDLPQRDCECSPRPETWAQLLARKRNQRLEGEDGPCPVLREINVSNIITGTTTTTTTTIIIITPSDENADCYLSLDMLRCHPQFVTATSITTTTTTTTAAAAESYPHPSFRDTIADTPSCFSSRRSPAGFQLRNVRGLGFMFWGFGGRLLTFVERQRT